MLYRRTPYLTQLQKQLGGHFGALVKAEIKNFREFREKIREIITNAEDPEKDVENVAKRQAVEWREKLPQNLQHTTAEFIGPEILPTRTTTEVQLVASGDDGVMYTMHYLPIFTEPNNEWRLTGKGRSLNGRLIPVEDEIKTYQPDDVSRFNDSVGSFLEGLDHFAENSFKYFEENPIGSGVGGMFSGEGMSMGDSFLVGSESNDGDDLFSTNTSSSSTSTYQSKAKKKIMQNANSTSETSFNGSSTSRSDAVSGPSTRISSKSVEKRLKRHSTTPQWYKNLTYEYSRNSSSWREFMEDYVTPAYNEANKKNKSWDVFWESVHHHAQELGMISTTNDEYSFW